MSKTSTRSIVVTCIESGAIHSVDTGSVNPPSL
jgi:hypothetical protein